jgi:hypothetical protein
MFEEEVKLIQDEGIKTFTLKCINAAPDYFWKIPASSTGKWHPSDELGEGGKYLHSRKVTRIAYDLCRNADIVGWERDCVVSAAIQHDFCSRGYPTLEKYTISGHGPLWIKMCEAKVCFSSQIFSQPQLKLIARLIGTHMGRWDMPFEDATDIFESIIQTSDYIASRKYISVDLTLPVET